MPRLVAVLAVGLFAPGLPAGDPTFEADIRPLFKAYCTDCHGEAEKPKGGLDLRLRKLALKGGESGPGFVAGQPDDSPIVQRVIDGEMPPGKKKLTAAEAELLRKWVAAGAKVEKPEPDAAKVGMLLTAEDRNYWTFRPVARPPLPSGAASNPIDRFLLAKLREKGLSFNPPADRAALVRRVTFDLVGLPPTPDEVEAFVADTATDAYDKLIDRLLASPHYGERWGRHWLDVAGYADSEGGSPQDPVRPTLWKYRDYVIRAFNADKPFDQFIREQLAGDELVGRPFADLPPEDVEKLTATGFLRTAPDGTREAAAADLPAARAQVVADTLRIVSSAFLGLTVGCAQCHNHRYDPIPQADFYRLRAVFEPAYNPSAWVYPADRRVSLATADQKKEAARLEAEAKGVDADRGRREAEFIAATLDKELAKLPEADRDAARAAHKAAAAKRTPEQQALFKKHPSLNVTAGTLYLYDKTAAAELKAMADKAAEVRKKKPAEEYVRALTEEPGRVPPTRLFHRGDPEQLKEEVPPGALAVLDDVLPLPAAAKTPAGTSGRRLALADWLTDPRNPLTPRVLANRVWLGHFGTGLVRTPGDFGRLGERPTHPELLDWLAAEFVAGGWSLKRLHRLILTSAAYQQSSVRDPGADAVDPENQLYARFPLRRLDAEAVRDAMLAASGELNRKMFGPPVPVMEDEAGQVVLGIDSRDGAGRFGKAVPLPPGDEARRSVYAQVRRSKPLAVLDAFDGAAAAPNCEARASSTVTPQALLLMNNEFVGGRAAALAKRVVGPGTDPRMRAAAAWRLAYGTSPTVAELDRASDFVRDQAAAGGPDRALAALCQVLLMSSRFLYVD